MLVQRDIHVLYGLVGDANLFLASSYDGEPGARYVPLLSESAAVHAATGHAAISGGLGAATVTHGPGLTNAITGLIEADKARVAVLFIAGDTAARDRDHHQNVPQAQIVAAAGIAFEQVRAPDTLATDLDTAIRAAVLGRRPVVLNVPAELMWCEVEPPGPSRPAASDRDTVPTPESVDAAARALAEASRVVVLAGRGACTHERRDALAALADRLGAALATTLLARDLFAGHPADIGVFGEFAEEHAREAIAGSDCVVAFGASLNGWTTAAGSLLAGTRVIQVDDDPAACGRYAEPNTFVLGDAERVAVAIRERLDAAGVPTDGFGRDAARGLGRSGASSDADGPIEIFAALALVDELFADDRVLVFDSGRFLRAAFRALHARQPHGFAHTVSFGAIGLGLATAVGAAVAGDGRPVLFTCGDGGLLLSGMSELATIAELGLPITLLLLDDGAYGAEHIQLVRRGLAPDLSLLPRVDFAGVARALGWRGHAPGDLSELRDALGDVAEHPGPALIDVRLDPSAVPSKAAA